VLGDSIILEEEIDPNYVPTEEEVLEYAKWLGMDLDKDKDLFWIAKEGLKAPLPSDWKPCKTTDTEEIYYFNFATGASTWDHPCDEYYRGLYEEHKKKKTSDQDKKQVEEKKAKEKEFISQVSEKSPRVGGRKKKKKGGLGSLDDLGPIGRGLDRAPLGAIGSGRGLGRSNDPLLGASKPLGGEKPKKKKKDRLRSALSESSDGDDDDGAVAKLSKKNKVRQWSSENRETRSWFWKHAYAHTFIFTHSLPSIHAHTHQGKARRGEAQIQGGASGPQGPAHPGGCDK
jgi:centrosomal protein CEP164